MIYVLVIIILDTLKKKVFCYLQNDILFLRLYKKKQHLITEYLDLRILTDLNYLLFLIELHIK